VIAMFRSVELDTGESVKPHALAERAYRSLKVVAIKRSLIESVHPPRNRLAKMNGKKAADSCTPKRTQPIGHSTRSVIIGPSSPNSVGPAT